MISICHDCRFIDEQRVIKSESVDAYRTLYEMRKSANHNKRRTLGRICSHCGIFKRDETEFLDFTSHKGYEQYLKKPLIKAKLRSLK